MGNLITVIGNTGVGKTTLVRALSKAGNFATGLEGHLERPFQALFKTDRRYALANQMDYLLLRAEQEETIRSGARTGVLDGGLEMDFYIFSGLFRQKGWLTEAEFGLLEKLVRSLRNYLPPPDVIIYMQASPAIIAERFRRRGRPLEIATTDDLSAIEALLTDWYASTDHSRIILLDATTEDPEYMKTIPNLLAQIQNFIGDL